MWSAFWQLVAWAFIVAIVLVEVVWWTFFGAGVLDGFGVPYAVHLALAVVPALVVLNRVEDLRSEFRSGRSRVEPSWVLHHDDFGRLWDAGLDAGGEPIRVVQVVNATPERDGSFRHYFLRVPPGVRTAQEAVAWTFGLDASEYAPVRES